jgi:hypothetical protein
MLSRQQKRRLAKHAKKRRGKKVPEDLIERWMLAFAQGRGKCGVAEAEAVKMANLCMVLYQVMDMDSSQLEGFCRETGARTDLGGLDDYLAYLDAMFGQMNQLEVGHDGPTRNQRTQRPRRLPSLKQMVDL